MRRSVILHKPASNEPYLVTTEQVKRWLIAERNTIPLFFSPYDVFTGKFQSAHFVIFRNVRLRRSCSTVQIHFIKSTEIICLDILMPMLALALLEISVAVANRSFFYSLPIHLSFLVVIFLCPPGSFLASPDPVSSSFLKILWITLFFLSAVFEISPIESLSSVRNLTISFLSSNDVTNSFAMFTMQEPV